ncbi:MAG: hypothetical protein VKL39_06245 [Leptolyngbyaceae bacterium]|nr:hypothetical protein [Leptolyngbyaceae bacterium]
MAVISIAALTSIPWFSASHQPTVDNNPAIAQPPAIPRYSPEQLARIRQSLLSQVAVYEPSEQAMRPPTPAEATQLSVPPVETQATAIVLPGGGVAIRTDLSQMSFLKAEVTEDGTIKIDHSQPGAGSEAETESHHDH